MKKCLSSISVVEMVTPFPKKGKIVVVVAAALVERRGLPGNKNGASPTHVGKHKEKEKSRSIDENFPLSKKKKKNRSSNSAVAREETNTRNDKQHQKRKKEHTHVRGACTDRHV